MDISEKNNISTTFDVRRSAKKKHENQFLEHFVCLLCVFQNVLHMPMSFNVFSSRVAARRMITKILILFSHSRSLARVSEKILRVSDDSED